MNNRHILLLLLATALYIFYSRFEPDTGQWHNYIKEYVNTVKSLIFPSQSDDEILQAVMRRNHAKIKTLLENGANPNTTDKEGRSLLYLASETYNDEITAKLLLQHGAEVNQKNSIGETALHACQSGKLASLLIAYGADVNALTKHQLSPLHGASYAKAKVLIQHHAKLDIASTVGWTPLHTACATANLTTARLLIQSGANVSAQNIYADTPVFMCAASGRKKPQEQKNLQQISILLVKKGIDLAHKNSIGKTAYDIAIKSRRYKLARILKPGKVHTESNLANGNNKVPLEQKSTGQLQPVQTKNKTISIIKDGFYPAKESAISLSAYYPGTIKMSIKRPATLIKQPIYKGKIQYYGKVQLGTRQNNWYSLVFDIDDAREKDLSSARLYIDSNRNHDLTDDYGPYINTRDKGFSTVVGIPAVWLYKQAIDWQDDIRLKFIAWTWDRKKMTIITDTALEGKIMLEGKEYQAKIAEVRTNNADFSKNILLYIDLNHDGVFKRKEESFTPQQVYIINHKRYRFDIRW